MRFHNITFDTKQGGQHPWATLILRSLLSYQGLGAVFSRTGWSTQGDCIRQPGTSANREKYVQLQLHEIGTEFTVYADNTLSYLQMAKLAAVER